MIRFRFQSLDVWNDAIKLIDKILDIADRLEKLKLYRFAEQLRGSAMSISNNIAEGSGSSSNKEFAYFLNISRRSIFENASILILLERRKYIDPNELNELLTALEIQSKKITNLRASILK